MDKPYIDLAIPSSFTLNLQSLTQRTLAVANLGRAAGTYGVENIYIYHDPLNHDPIVEKQVIKILKYMSTPPYLKKILFQRDPDLAYVGMAPPLTLRMHKKWVPIKDLKYPEYRIGIVIGRSQDRYLIDVGLDKPVAVRDRPPQDLVIVEISKSTSKYLIGRVLKISEYKDLGIYPGYKVRRVKTGLATFLNRYNGLKICLTRYGDYVGDIWKRLKEDLGNTDRVLLLLGSFEYGLKEIFNILSIEPNKVCRYSLNLVYDQEVETIRVEEAALIGLSIIDFLKHLKL